MGGCHWTKENTIKRKKQGACEAVDRVRKSRLRLPQRPTQHPQDRGVLLSVSSVYHPRIRKAAMDHEASSTARNAQLGDDLHLTAVKKRIWAIMGCQGSPDRDNSVKKRPKTDLHEARQQRKDCIAIEVKPISIKPETAKLDNSPLHKQKLLPELKSPRSKSNVTEASSLTQDHLSTKHDYIHVRARRGQATDSHSLAERVRREKICERMKYLQDLVPSCVKVTGKAMMLDEIINYVQSLQRQVEFLSMKLAAAPPNRLECDFDDLFSKKAVQPSHVTNGSGSSNAAVTQATVLLPATDYSSNPGQSDFFHNSIRSDEMLPDSGCAHDVTPSMQLQTLLNEEMIRSLNGADQFFASLSCDLGMDFPLMHQNAVHRSSSNLAVSPTDVTLSQPVQRVCFSQGSGQVEREWDEDLQNVVQQMGVFNSQANLSWLPLDNLLTEGCFLQCVAKEEL